MGIVDRIKEIEFEYARTQKNKATEGHLGLLKAKLAKLRSELLQENSSGGGGGGEGFGVQRSGDGRVALIGFPSVGKSSLLSTLTETESEAAGYEFTTLTCIPGNLVYNDTKIQLLDLPGIIEGAAHGKGRGREVIAVARTSDLILMVLDGCKEGVDNHRAILERELETVGLRLNKTPPNINFVKKKTGGIKVNSTCPLTHLGEDPEKTVYSILHEYKIHNCEVLIRDDVTTDEVIDVICGNRKYVRCLYAYNKIDLLTIEDVDALAREPHSVVISVHSNYNLDFLLEKMWEYMGLIRIYTKRRGAPPDLSEPVVLSSQRHGITIETATNRISKELIVIFNYAEVWGSSAKHNPQRVGLAHTLEDEDVVQIVAKTNNQQKLDKGYSMRVQNYNKGIAEKRKTRTKDGKKKRSTG
ncbi:DRG2, developmentally regulated GTPase 2 [Pelagophyceae sp. CCMP2097]|nr:DRG2, developmentally regulated GTPase 2 [Pelagophyceae sp. CCMP2097]|mmetsp:Transcript_20776/g.70412  ORF Transcript_20776/g.70412 Transcript_20776/m.70412 type:complete len:414 (+) Transcript_20776:99-1340(+)